MNNQIDNSNHIKNIVFLEYMVSTGFPDENLLNEGKLMFDTLLKQFLNSDLKYNLTCFLDEKVYNKYSEEYKTLNNSSNGNLTIVITHNEWNTNNNANNNNNNNNNTNNLTSDYKEKLSETLEKFNNIANVKNNKTAGFIIGPENDNELEKLTQIIENNKNIVNLGCNSEGVKIAGNKYLTYLAIKDTVPTPYTLPIKKYIIKENLGCDGIHDVIGDNLIVQEYFEGVPYSYIFIVSKKLKNELNKEVNNELINNRYDLYPICMNKQYIEECYCGGEININHKLKETAKELCAKALQCIDGLNGYVGVDFMINEETNEITIIEVNPRITTSIHGINTEPPLSELLIKNITAKMDLNYVVKKGIKFYRADNGFKFEELN
ncbi:ATP-grasp domain-containing protein [Methanococcus voltae]|uniref:ATP-grasp domain-containing protein n=1 Tax=Methanococcus voltae TaxID=2188 RepID=UPI000690012A|nr:ATP-grasp domain-containing protein [Methanococcus voltae]MCS3901271.1 putative ATP-grasp superfamily ATP-dependent carboligase [Methanococcus voltae]